MKSTLAAALAALAIGAGAPAAHAAVLFKQTIATPQIATPGLFDVIFESAGGAGTATFQIIGFGTLDGANVSNDLQDIFSLSLNGIEILRGAWDLGGGGQNILFVADPSATALAHSNGFNRGGAVDIFTPLALTVGTNTLRFAFSSAVPQGKDDEAWALGQATVLGAAPPSAAPEPAAWALMLMGFAGIGGALRRQEPRLQK